MIWTLVRRVETPRPKARASAGARHAVSAGMRPWAAFAPRGRASDNRTEDFREADAPSQKVRSHARVRWRSCSVPASLPGRPARKLDEHPRLTQPGAHIHPLCLREIEPWRDRRICASAEIRETGSRFQNSGVRRPLFPALQRRILLDIEYRIELRRVAETSGSPRTH